jgi:hypothetical protein
MSRDDRDEYTVSLVRETNDRSSSSCQKELVQYDNFVLLLEMQFLFVLFLYMQFNYNDIVTLERRSRLSPSNLLVRSLVLFHC